MLRHNFPEDQVFMVLDYETYSEADIKKVGGYEYSRHPSTEVLCVAWSIGTLQEIESKPAQSWFPDQTHGNFSEFLKGLLNDDIILVAHNAFFDRMITENVFAVKDMYSKKQQIQSIPIDRWLCTAALSSARALPRKLEWAVDALNLPMKKNKDGSRLIKKFSKPRTPSKTNPRTRNTFENEPEDFLRFVEYCRDDVNATAGLLKNLDMLTPTERQVWCLDQRINEYGFRVDRELVSTVLEMIENESKALNQEVQDITFGLVDSATQRNEILKFCQEEGVFLPDLTRATVESAVKDGLATGDAKRLLEIRLAISKTSTAKYVAFDQRSATDGRLRDNIVYHTASTGRWGGAGVQPQNIPRGTIKDSILASEVLLTGDLELVRMIYGEPMEVFSSCLRNMIIATEGHTFDVVDYAAIEARVLFWVAEDHHGVEAFAKGIDLYMEQAAEVFERTFEEIESLGKDSFERFIGKQLILGCGYQMGPPKFVESCAKYNREVSLELASRAVSTYRSTHRPVVLLWQKIEKAAMSAVQNPGLIFSINKTKWFCDNDVLYCELPSGRRLAYQTPHIIHKQTQWGVKPTLHFWGVDSKTKKWCKQNTYGGKLVENVVQGIARDLMAYAMLRIDKTGIWKLVLSVHDELIAERPVESSGSLEQFKALMERLPKWAAGCPVATDGWSGPRYRKA